MSSNIFVPQICHLAIGMLVWAEFCNIDPEPWYERLIRREKEQIRMTEDRMPLITRDTYQLLKT